MRKGKHCALLLATASLQLAGAFTELFDVNVDDPSLPPWPNELVLGTSQRRQLLAVACTFGQATACTASQTPYCCSCSYQTCGGVCSQCTSASGCSTCPSNQGYRACCSLVPDPPQASTQPSPSPSPPAFGNANGANPPAVTVPPPRPDLRAPPPSPPAVPPAPPPVKPQGSFATGPGRGPVGSPKGLPQAPAVGLTNYVTSINDVAGKDKDRTYTCQDNIATTQYIISRSVTTTSTYPYMVSLRSSESAAGDARNPAHFCGGILLFEKVILTAAHCCLENKTADSLWVPQYAQWGGVDSIAPIRNPPTAVIGASCINEVGVDSQKISSALVHPLWNGDYRSGYDICLMFTERAFKSSDPNAKAANGKVIGTVFPKLPKNNSWTSGNFDEIDYRLQAVGWGQSGPDNDRSPQMKNATLKWNSQEICARLVQNSNQTTIPFKSNQFCASSPFGATCSGDSGGPILYSPSGGMDPSSDIILGVVSYGPGQCQLEASWTVFTDVLSYNEDFAGSCSPNITTSGSTKDNWIGCTLSRRNFNLSSLAP